MAIVRIDQTIAIPSPYRRSRPMAVAPMRGRVVSVAVMRVGAASRRGVRVCRPAGRDGARIVIECILLLLATCLLLQLPLDLALTLLAQLGFLLSICTFRLLEDIDDVFALLAR